MNKDSVQHEAEPWQPHLQTLHRMFYENANDRCLLWVNPAQGDPFAEDSLVEERRVGVPIQHPNFNALFAPYLVALDLSKSRDADVFKRSVAMTWKAWEFESLIAFNGQPVGGWIASDQTALILAQYWATCCHIHFINECTKLLRFHDPGPREWLWRLLTPSQQAQLIGPASFIVALDRNHELMMRSVHRLDAYKEEPTAAGKLVKLQLTPAQWNQIDDYAVVHGAWLRRRVILSSSSQKATTGYAWEQAVFHALRAASAYEITDKNDRELFASHALQLGPDFHEHASMQPVWKKIYAGDYYGAACEEVFGQPADELPEYLQSK